MIWFLLAYFMALVGFVEQYPLGAFLGGLLPLVAMMFWSVRNDR